jgi:hypothetical protein
MTLIVVLNAVLAVLILSVIVALHTAAIFTDRRQAHRPATLSARGRVAIRPAAHASGYDRAPVSRAAAQRRKPLAA